MCMVVVLKFTKVDQQGSVITVAGSLKLRAFCESMNWRLQLKWSCTKLQSVIRFSLHCCFDVTTYNFKTRLSVPDFVGKKQEKNFTCANVMWNAHCLHGQHVSWETKKVQDLGNSTSRMIHRATRSHTKFFLAYVTMWNQGWKHGS